MLERIRDRNVLVVYAATLLLCTGYGLAISLTSLHLDARHFTRGDIGGLAAWFALGIVALSIPAGALIRRFSARAVLLTSLVGYAACVTAFPHLEGYRAIAAARVLDGAFSVGVWVASETILLSRAGKDHKAYVTSLYAVTVALGYVLGPVVARVLTADAPTPEAFAVSGALALVAAAVVVARLDPDVPETHAHEGPAETTRTSAGEVTWRIKVSCFGTFAYGYFQASAETSSAPSGIPRSRREGAQPASRHRATARAKRGGCMADVYTTYTSGCQVLAAAGSSFAKATVKATNAAHSAARCQSIAAPPQRSKRRLETGGPRSIPAA